MKRTKQRIAITLLSAALTTISLSACSASRKSPFPADSSSDSITTAAYVAQIESYEALISELQDRLLKEKEENYIQICEYRLQIEDLEQSIRALSDRIGYESAEKEHSYETNVPVQSSEDSTLHGTPPAQLSAKSEFIYDVAEGTVTITGYIGDSQVVTVPSSINGCTVTAIGEGAFQGTAVTKITLPESISSIGWFAFADCLTLTEVAIPSSVTSIGYGVFERCPTSMRIKCKSDSYAKAYAASWGIRTLED